MKSSVTYYQRKLGSELEPWLFIIIYCAMQLYSTQYFQQWNEKAQDNQSQKDSTEQGLLLNLAGGEKLYALLSY